MCCKRPVAVDLAVPKKVYTVTSKADAKDNGIKLVSQSRYGFTELMKCLEKYICGLLKTLEILDMELSFFYWLACIYYITGKFVYLFKGDLTEYFKVIDVCIPCIRD